MNSLIVRFLAQVSTPVLLTFSIYLLMRGHNFPGGGFVGGLIAACAFVLQVMASDIDKARRLLRVEPHLLMGAGILIAVISGLISPLSGGKPAFLTGVWVTLPVIGYVGTPVLFDVGVYLVVLGSSLMIFFHMREGR